MIEEINHKGLCEVCGVIKSFVSIPDIQKGKDWRKMIPKCKECYTIGEQDE